MVTIPVDFDGLIQLIVALPLRVAEYSGLGAGEAGQSYFVRVIDGKGALHHYDLNTRKDETLLPDVAGYMLSADGKKLLYRSGAAWAIGPAKGKIDPGTGRLAVDSIDVYAGVTPVSVVTMSPDAYPPLRMPLI